MKVADYTGNPTQATPFETANIGIAKSHEGQLMILNVLSSTLYSDKISAVWREYGCNAVDANIEAGKPDLPIKIVLPTNISPTAIIRDYGTGISREDMLGRFLWMGESTKRDSNKVTGMIGIGRMSGLAYGDSFLVVSYRKGTKITYNVYRDQGVPKLAVMHEDQTDEPDGLEIKVPVRREDINTFAERAERTFRYFKVRPEVKGGTINWQVHEPKFKGSCWAITGSGSSVAVMGNVGYAIDKYAMGADNNAVLAQGAILYFDIGELEITANREGLQYKGKTIPALKAKLKVLSSELAATITKTIASAPSFWDAKKAFGAAFERSGDTSYYGAGLAGIVSNQVTWNGIPLKSGRFEIFNDLGKDKSPDLEITVTLYDKSSYYHRTVRRNPEPHNIYANDKNFLVENDLPKKGPSPARVRQYFVDHPDVTALAILTFQTDKAKDRYIKAKHMEGAPMLLLSTFPKPAPIAGASKASGPYNSKYSAKAFVFDENAKSISTYYTNREKCSDWWKQEIVNKKTGGVYVVLRAFEIVTLVGGCVSPSNFTSYFQSLKKSGMLKTPLYGFKEDKAAKLDSQWVKLEDHLKAQLEAAMKSPTAKRDLADYFEAAKYDGFISEKHLSSLPINCLAAQLITTRKNAMSVKHNEIYGVLFDHQRSPFLACPVLANSALNFDKLEKQVKDRYPLLEILQRFHVLDDDPKDFKPIADYINLIEKSKP